MILQRTQGEILSPRDSSMLVYVRDRLHRSDPPTFDEIAMAYRCSTREAIAAMRRLKKQGYLRWDPLRPRSFELLKSPALQLELPLDDA